MTHLDARGHYRYLDQGDELNLRCPSCGFEYTHIDHVEVVSAGGQAVHVSAMGEDDHARLRITPAADYRGTVGRRHVVVLYVSCEGCAVSSKLVFRQHKGVTVLETDTR